MLTATAFNYEAQSSYAIRVRTMDQGGLWFEKPFTVTVTDVNETPTVVTLSHPTTTLPEDTSTASRIKVADIVVTDDALGSNVLSLSDADAALFEIVGTELYLKAGTALDYETNPVLDVTVAVDDATVGTTPDATAVLTITVTDVNEPPVLGTIGAKAVAELAALTFTVSATDADLPAQTLTYSATGLPAGAAFDPATRQFSWTATEAQGLGSYDVTFAVSKGGEKDRHCLLVFLEQHRGDQQRQRRQQRAIAAFPESCQAVRARQIPRAGSLTRPGVSG